MQNKILLSDNIFVAGSSGMVGNAITKKLKEKGYGLNKYNGKLLTPKRKELNLLNSEYVNEWFSFNKPNIVILAAAKVGGILANSLNPADFLFENLKIQTNVIEASWKNNVKRLLFLGSSCIYPKYAPQPLKEEYLLRGELEQTNNSYALAKIAGIKLCESLNIQYGFDAISLMPTNLYGPKDNYDLESSHVFAALIRKFSDAIKYSQSSVNCWGSGNPLREFMHVDDLASAVIFALEKWNPNEKNAPKNTNGEKLYHLNVGTGKDISIKDLASKIAEFTSFKGDIFWDKSKPDGTPKKQLDISKIKSLGWEPEIELEEGLKKTIEDYLQNNY